MGFPSNVIAFRIRNYLQQNLLQGGASPKKEELIHVQKRADPIRLGRENLGLKLCQAIRDEAHRFAQHYHHILRSKALFDETGGPPDGDQA